MYTEEDLLPISALQHLAFCERQWALIHIEQIWVENFLTVEGNVIHERTDQTDTEVRGNIRIARGLRIRSMRLGLTGKADVVEFHRKSEDCEEIVPQQEKPESICIDNVSGFWRPVPVEYKRGRPKPDRCDEVQLCAQALCLEEMLDCIIKTGCLYYGQPRRRYNVNFADILREETISLSQRLHIATRAQVTPEAKFEKKCQSCSLLSFCLPKAMSIRKNVLKYLAEMTGEPGSGEKVI
jgi:CRISPR-associated exonuclease Cas4